MEGFNSYNIFKKGIKELKQLYDLTYHLYLREHERVSELLPNSKQAESVETNIGVINHSLMSIFYHTETKYPNSLRQLILVSSITYLEVYLTDTIIEAYKRDPKPFAEQTPIEFMKGHLLNSPSLTELQDEIIERDKRRLSSGGLAEIRKYYQKKFKINFGSLNCSINEIEEIHTRRHLFVHRNGVCDKTYANKYPKMGYLANEKIVIDHEYFVSALDKLSTFGSEINKEMLNSFPIKQIRNEHFYNEKLKVNEKLTVQKLMIELRIRNINFDIIQFLKELKVNSHHLINYLSQVNVKNRSCIFVLIGDPDILRKFFMEIKSQEEFDFHQLIELKK